MPAYDFYCPSCRKTHERILPAARRNDTIKCPQGHAMKRQLSAPMATLWNGKFQGRWNKVKEGEW